VAPSLQAILPEILILAAGHHIALTSD
jgi:hypothetical protein